MPDKYIVLSVDEWIIRVVLFENSTNAANKKHYIPEICDLFMERNKQKFILIFFFLNSDPDQLQMKLNASLQDFNN